MVFKHDYVAIAGGGLVAQGAEVCRWFAGGQWRKYNQTRRVACRSLKSRLRVEFGIVEIKGVDSEWFKSQKGCRDAMRDEVKLG
jgi:hypothetical protein